MYLLTVSIAGSHILPRVLACVCLVSFLVLYMIAKLSLCQTQDHKICRNAIYSPFSDDSYM